MRSLALFLAVFYSFTLHAESSKPAPDQQTLESIKQFALTHLDRSAGLSCTQAGSPSSSRTITIELSETPKHHGTDSSIDAGALFEHVFAPSGRTEFQFDHWAAIHGKNEAVYRYSNHNNGKTHAGLIYADETTGAISRITFRGADTAAHLFCSAQSR
jgi:hypothetical protein